jgi:hypothetical protein
MLAIIATIIFAVAFVLTIVGVGGVLVASLPLLGLAGRSACNGTARAGSGVGEAPAGAPGVCTPNASGAYGCSLKRGAWSPGMGTQPIVLVGGRQDGEVLRWRGAELPKEVRVPAGEEVLTYVATDQRDRHGSLRYVLTA